jgi:D-glycero-alpha-D-manno-heptose 1-phosphate guanylyltransferase
MSTQRNATQAAMEAIVLAGGLGTRLRAVVADVPKPMAPVGGRPFLAFVLDRLVDAGFATAILAVGYRFELIRSHFGDGYRGLRLAYSVEHEPQGTGGALRDALALGSGGETFVVNGDTWLDVDYRAMLSAHKRSEAQLTIAVHRVADVGRYGALELEGNRVRGFREKGESGAGWINGGIYVVGPALRACLRRDGAFSFEQDVLVPAVASIAPLAFRTAGQFIDIGIPDDYARARQILADPDLRS